MSGLAFDPVQARSREALLREFFPDGIQPRDYNLLPMAQQLIEEYQDKQPSGSRIYLIGGGDDFCVLVRDILANIERGRALKITVQEEVV